MRIGIARATTLAAAGCKAVLTTPITARTTNSQTSIVTGSEANPAAAVSRMNSDEPRQTMASANRGPSGRSASRRESSRCKPAETPNRPNPLRGDHVVLVHDPQIAGHDMLTRLKWASPQMAINNNTSRHWGQASCRV